MITARGWMLAAVVTLLPAAVRAQTGPIWSKPDHFWFQKSVPGGHLWLNVDALHGVKEPLFDHQRLAIELSLRTGEEYTPLTLPFADPAAGFVVKYDGSNAYIQQGAMAIEFVHGGSLWRCDLQIKWNWNLVPPTDYECRSRRPITDGDGAAKESASRVSPDGRWEAVIHEHNVAVRRAGAAAAPTRLSSDGSAADAYQLGSVRWTTDSRTLTAYRVHSSVWLSDTVTGNVKRQLAEGQWTVPGR